MQLLDQRSTQRAPASAKALASVLISTHNADVRRPRIRHISGLDRIRGGKAPALDALDEEDLLNLDVGKPKGKPNKQAAAPGKSQMPSAEEIQQIMNDPQYQEQMKKMMSDPNFQDEMRKAAEQMKEMLTPEDMEMLEQLKNDPSFQEHAKKIAEQMATDPEFMKAAEKQAEMMQDMIDQTMKDPAIMQQLQGMLDDPAAKGQVKKLLQEIAQVLPAGTKEEFQKVIDAPDLEEKMKSAKTLSDLLK
jgi:hypothetical protein